MKQDSIRTRVDALDWQGIAEQLDARGFARTAPLLTPTECRALAALDDDPTRFRSRIDMARYRFGEGAYGYFAHPLPELVANLREALYPRLAPIANRMMERMGLPTRYAPRLRSYLRRCHAAGQKQPTPLLLRYGPGGFNCLHRDLYGELLFPLQATAMLSRPGTDYEGGAFLLVENRPRQQARGEAITAAQGELLIFPVHERPVQEARGVLRAAMRHGVSRIHSGERFALGIIFHDAK
ncbi:MAG: 2OG-Fe(II) oxygenase [SAR324 cluster bacterium]|nr:2OG-Fe(II) oxygenase [SAR324 cluster bacterium]